VVDSALCVEAKRLFSIAPEAREGGESPECLSLKNSNWTLEWMRSRVDQRVRLVHLGVEEKRTQSAQPVRPRVPRTGASG
jgi:hypothetical protein